MWNFIRLENEHLNNCGQFRIVRDISIAPVEMKVVVEEKIMTIIQQFAIFQDQEEILTLMDNPDGALIVRRRRKEFAKK